MCPVSAAVYFQICRNLIVILEFGCGCMASGVRSRVSSNLSQHLIIIYDSKCVAAASGVRSHVFSDLS